jgi:hypothetical protein
VFIHYLCSSFFKITNELLISKYSKPQFIKASLSAVNNSLQLSFKFLNSGGEKHRQSPSEIKAHNHGVHVKENTGQIAEKPHNELLEIVEPVTQMLFANAAVGKNVRKSRST